MQQKLIGSHVLRLGKDSLKARKDTSWLDLKQFQTTTYRFGTAQFSFAGSLNIINIWDRSPLYESMLDELHDQLDCPFDINQQQFEHLY